jgi:hypothetical protein
MMSLVLGSALAFFPGARSTSSVRRPPQVTGPLPSIRRARPLIVACSEQSRLGDPQFAYRFENSDRPRCREGYPTRLGLEQNALDFSRVFSLLTTYPPSRVAYPAGLNRSVGITAMHSISTIKSS